MNNILEKIKDTLLCVMGTVFIMMTFTTIVVMGKPKGSLSHHPIQLLTATVRYIGGSK